MSSFIEGENRYQSTLVPERVDDYVEEDSVVRVIDVFIDRLDIPARLNDDLVTTQRAVDAAVRLFAFVAAEVTHSAHASLDFSCR